MKVQVITNYGKMECVEIPYIPRVGESICLSNMPYMYHEGNGESPRWIVTDVETYLGCGEDSMGEPKVVYEGATIRIKNEDDQ